MNIAILSPYRGDVEDFNIAEFTAESLLGSMCKSEGQDLCSVYDMNGCTKECHGCTLIPSSLLIPERMACSCSVPLEFIVLQLQAPCQAC